jgi:serine/threonine protein kinase
MLGDAPRRIGRYEVIRPIAAGDTADLFLAKQVGLEGFERVVFIKRVRDDFAAEEAFVRSFLDEARLVAKLSHPNIVEVYDLGKDGEAYFVAMEYVQGRTLAKVAARAAEKGARLPPQFVVRCVSEICSGLQFAHTMVDALGRTQNIIHGAISPRKILVSFSGISKVRDFGIAKAATMLAETRVGLFKGRYAYMSPEQVRRMPLDARSDVFALGIILYELLVGSHPFKRGNSILTLTAIAEERHIEARDAATDIAPRLADIVDRALSKKRTKRFASAEELQLELEDYLTEAPRADPVEVRRIMQSLFEGDLVRGGALLDIPGVGEIILPESDGPPTQIISEDQTTIAPDDMPRVRIPTDSDTEIAPFHDQDTSYGGNIPEIDETLTSGIADEETHNFVDETTSNLGGAQLDTSVGASTGTYKDMDSALSHIFSPPSSVRDPAGDDFASEYTQPEDPQDIVPDDVSVVIPVSDSAIIQDAFLDFHPPPPKPQLVDPEPLPLDALTPLDVDPNERRPKREIVEVIRPGPQAPTEFNPGLADQAAAILAQPPVRIQHLPSIVRERYEDLDMPRVEVSSAAPAPSAPLLIPPSYNSSAKLTLPSPQELRLGETAEMALQRTPLSDALAGALSEPNVPPPVHTPLSVVQSLPLKLLLALTGILVVLAVGLLVLSMRSDGVRVNVRSSPEGASVTVNGQAQPKVTPLYFEGKAGATYQVRVEKEGFLPAIKTIQVPQGSRNVLVDVGLQK